MYTIPEILSCMNFHWYNKRETGQTVCYLKTKTNKKTAACFKIKFRKTSIILNIRDRKHGGNYN